MKLTQREIFLLGIYGVIISMCVVCFLFFQFIYTQYDQINTQIVSTKNTLVKISNILADKETVQKEYAEFIQKLSPGKIKETVTTEILENIKNEAVAAQLNIINIKPFSFNGESCGNEFNFKLETEGQMENLGKFLFDLNNSPNIFAIKYIQINAQAQEEPLKFQFLLSAILLTED